MASKPKPSRHAPEEIDAYIAELPPDVRDLLAHVRAVIREAAPKCTERVSYKIPIFRLGKDVLGISVQANHCSLHTMSPALVKRMAETLKDTNKSGATLHFTTESPLPDKLITLIVQERIKEIQGN